MVMFLSLLILPNTLKTVLVSECGGNCVHGKRACCAVARRTIQEFLLVDTPPLHIPRTSKYMVRCRRNRFDQFELLVLFVSPPPPPPHALLTRRSLGLGVRSNVGNSLFNSVDLLCLGIRDLHRKLVLECHHHLCHQITQTTENSKTIMRSVHKMPGKIYSVQSCKTPEASILHAGVRSLVTLCLLTTISIYLTFYMHTAFHLHQARTPPTRFASKDVRK